MANAWVHSFGGAVTVCDSEGKILYMNKKSQSTFAGDGGCETYRWKRSGLPSGTGSL